jgi:hypothetical protein
MIPPRAEFLSRAWKIRLLILIWIVVAIGFWNFISFGTDLLIKRPGVTQERPVLPPATDRLIAKNPRGDEIPAWWYQGQPGAAAVLLCHGHGVSHLHMDDMLVWLKDLGFSVLLLDFRAHGEGGGTYSTLGRDEWEDIAAVLGESERRGWLPAGVPLAAFGRSMGAVALINGAAHLPRIQAFMIESMYARLRLIAENDFAWVLGILGQPLVKLVFFNAWVRTGIDYEESRPVDRLAGVAGRPLLIIHDDQDYRADTRQFDMLCQTASHARQLVIRGAGHVQGFQAKPELFQRTIIEFLASAGFDLPLKN